MNGSRGYEQGCELSSRYNSCYKDDYKRSRNNYYEGGDYNRGQKNEAIDLNHFYDGGDFKHPQRDIHNVEYGSPHYRINSPSEYRVYAQQNRRAKEMLTRNGL